MSIGALFSPEILIFLELAAAGALFLFFIMKKDFTCGLYAWLLATLFFRYTKVNMADSIMPDLSINRVVFAFILLMFILEVVSKKRGFFRLTAIEYLMFLFCLYLVISMSWTGIIVKEEGRFRIGEFLTGYMMPFSMFFISQNVYDSHRKRDGFIRFMLAIGLYLGLTAVFEHFNVRSLVFPRYILNPDFGLNYGRARGPFVASAANGLVLGFVFFACLYVLFDSGKKGLWKFYSLVLSVLAPLAIFFTYTRSCWISFIVGIAALIAFSGKNKKQIIAIVFIILLVVMIIGVFFVLDEDAYYFLIQRLNQKESVNDRLMLYPVYIKMFKEYPLFGVGFCRFSEYLGDYLKQSRENMPVQSSFYNADHISIHDTFGGILAEMGFVGIGLLLPIYFLILSRAIKLYRRLTLEPGEGSALVGVFFAFFIAYIATSIFIDTRNFEFINCLFFIFCGVICGWEREYYAKTIA